MVFGQLSPIGVVSPIVVVATQCGSDSSSLKKHGACFNTPVDYRLSASRGVRPHVSLRASRQRPFLDRTLGLFKASARPGLPLFLADLVWLLSEPQHQGTR
jgi:hypothetical protein